MKYVDGEKAEDIVFSTKSLNISGSSKSWTKNMPFTMHRRSKPQAEGHFLSKETQREFQSNISYFDSRTSSVLLLAHAGLSCPERVQNWWDSAAQAS